MNSWLDRGLFLLTLYTVIYIFSNGKEPSWSLLYIGAAGIVAVGIIIELTKAGKLK